jgi:hypothetical protein
MASEMFVSRLALDGPVAGCYRHPVKRRPVRGIRNTTALCVRAAVSTGPADHEPGSARAFTLSGGAVAWRSLLHKQWLGDLADQPVRVEQVGVGESDAIVSQIGAAYQVHPFPRRRAQQGRGHGGRNREPLLQRQRQASLTRRGSRRTVPCRQAPAEAPRGAGIEGRSRLQRDPWLKRRSHRQ